MSKRKTAKRKRIARKIVLQWVETAYGTRAYFLSNQRLVEAYNQRADSPANSLLHAAGLINPRFVETPKARVQPKTKTSKSFYRSVEWKRARYDALKASSGCCELCGLSAHEGAILNVDHIKPLKTHWHLRLELTNLQVLCGSCNCGKGNRDDTDWREPSLRVLMGEAMTEGK